MPTIEKAFAADYVRNIPWEKHPLFAFSKDTEAYREAIEASIEKLPVGDKEINFDDNAWDFRPYFQDNNRPSYKLNFDGKLPERLITYLKFYCLHEIFGYRKIPTINASLQMIQTTYRDLFTSSSNNTLETITDSDIVASIKKRDLSALNAYHYAINLYLFYKFIISNYQLELPVALDSLHAAAISLRQKAVRENDKNKLPNIPKEYFQSILSVTTTVMRNSEASHNDRTVASIIVMLTQLGMRLGDLLILKTNSMQTTTLSGSNISVNFIHYKAAKPSKAHQPTLEFNIVANALTTEAFNTLVSIRNNAENAKNNDYIFTLQEKGTNNNRYRYPITNDAFNRACDDFFVKYLSEECHTEWNGISPHKHRLYMKDGVTEYDEIYVPDSRQYRVYVCTYYYEHRIPLVYIQRFMGHLTEAMLGYYVRPKDTIQEDLAVAEKVVSSIVVDDNTPIGYMGDELKQRMKDFLANGNVNVSENIKAAVDAFGDRVIIRSKEGGACVCIKASFMPCAYDARSNEVLCAYGNCLNIYRFYYHVDISYMDFITAAEACQHDLDAGHKMDGQRELMKVKDICKRRLIPQLSELEKELAKNGKDSILDKYPSLRFVIDNKELIKNEVDIWMKK